MSKKAKIRSNLGKIYRLKSWAVRWARGRPVKKVPGGWKIMAKRSRKSSYSKSRRKTYKKKSTAKRAARRRSVYKVKGPPAGWRISRKRR